MVRRFCNLIPSRFLIAWRIFHFLQTAIFARNIVFTQTKLDNSLNSIRLYATKVSTHYTVSCRDGNWNVLTVLARLSTNSLYADAPVCYYRLLHYGKCTKFSALKHTMMRHLSVCAYVVQRVSVYLARVRMHHRVGVMHTHFAFMCSCFRFNSRATTYYNGNPFSVALIYNNY